MTNQDLHCRNFTTKRSEPVYCNNGKLMIDTSNIDSNLNLLNDNLTRVNPTSTVSEAIPVRLMVGIAGENFNPLRSIGSDLAVYIDDMNVDAVNNSGISKASLQTDANNKLDLISLEATQLNVLSNVGSIKNNTSDTAINTYDIGNNTSNIDTQFNVLNDNLTRVNPTSTVSEAIPVRLMVGTAGANFNPLRSIGSDLAVYIDDMNVDAVNNSGISKASLQTDANTKLDLINTSLTKGQTTMALSLPVVLASDQTDINTKINTLRNEGSHNNLNNDTTINFSDVGTLEADISNMRYCNIVYSDSSTASIDSVGVEVSGDGGTNFYEIAAVYPNTPAGSAVRIGYGNFNIGGFTLMRIRNQSADTNFNNVQCSVFGSP
jgi:hypothetical protein